MSNENKCTVNICFKSNNTIKDHFFFPDKRKFAIVNGNNVEIFRIKSDGKSIEKIHVLEGHEKPIVSIDISNDGKKVLTSSQDRNALVWEYNPKKNKYCETLVLLRLGKATTCCKWSPDGSKFAVGSSDKIIAICYYEKENNWWISKHIKKYFKSSITTLSWHPNNILLSCGSFDGSVRIFSAYLKDFDKENLSTSWVDAASFQTLCFEHYNASRAWVHDVCFSPKGDVLAYASHDSTISIVYFKKKESNKILCVKTNHLPFRSLVFLNDNKIIAGGYDFQLVVFKGDENGWKETNIIEYINSDKRKSAISDNEDQEISSYQALNMFKQLDLKGKVNQFKRWNNDESLETIHQNTINKIRILTESKVSSSGDDGKLIITSY